MVAKILTRLRKNISRFRLRKEPQFPLEKKLLNGKHLPQKTERPSILFATMHKAASVYVWDLLKDFARITRHIPVDFEGYHYYQGQLDSPIEQHLLRSTGFLCGPFRNGIDKIVGDELDSLFAQSKIIIQLRDPRDVLTSSYYSFLYSHSVAKKDKHRMLEMRKRMASQSLADHVKAHAGHTKKLLQSYCGLFKKENCLVLHYEDMILNPEKWCAALLEFLEINDNHKAQKICDRILRNAQEASSKKENVNQHRRKVTPGDFREKLPEELVSDLNTRFQFYFNTLERMGILPVEYGVQTSNKKSA